MAGGEEEMNVWIAMFALGVTVGLLSATKHLEPYIFGWAVTFVIVKSVGYLLKAA